MNGLFLVLLLTGSRDLGYRSPYGGAALRGQSERGFLEAAYYDAEPRGGHGWGGVARGEIRFGQAVYFGLGAEGIFQRAFGADRTDVRPTLRLGWRTDEAGDLSVFAVGPGIRPDHARGAGVEWRLHWLVFEGGYYEFQRDGSRPAYSGVQFRVGWSVRL